MKISCSHGYVFTKLYEMKLKEGIKSLKKVHNYTLFLEEDEALKHDLRGIELEMEEKGLPIGILSTKKMLDLKLKLIKLEANNALEAFCNA